jgi:aquaporin Z
LEAILTAVLVFVVFATMVDKRGPVSFGPLVIGLTVVVVSIAGGAISGAALNPARAIGPVVVSGSYNDLAVWIVGPAAGALVGILYEFLFLKTASKKA